MFIIIRSYLFSNNSERDFILIIADCRERSVLNVAVKFASESAANYKACFNESRDIPQAIIIIHLRRWEPLRSVIKIWQ